MEFFLQLVARAGIREGECKYDSTVVGEKPPTSPSYGSGWHATLRVNELFQTTLSDGRTSFSTFVYNVDIVSD